jgi:tetratricopeptide (TPR) repeat protein
VTYAQADDARAIRLFREAERQAPLSTKAFLQFAESARRVDGPSAAIPILREAVQAHPANADVHYALGMALWEANSIDPDAAASVERAVALGGYFVHRFQLSGMYVQLGRLDEAEQVARVLLSQPNGRADAYARLGDIAARRGRAAQAKRCFQLALQSSPGRTDLAAATGDPDPRLPESGSASGDSPARGSEGSC